MAFGDVVQSNSGSGTTASVTVSLPGAVTAGNMLFLSFAADDYNATPPAYWTQRTGGEQQTFHGGYLWDRLVLANGETIAAYTIGSAVRSAWALVEIAGPFDGYDISNGTFVQTSTSSIATPNLTPTSGDRLLVASIAFQHASNDLTALDTFTNSFVESRQSLSNGANPRLSIAQTRLIVAANGSTAYSTGASDGTSQSRSAIINAYKKGAVAAGGNMKVYSGAAWAEKPTKVWTGSAWVTKPVKFWNGSAWVLA